MSLQLTDPSLFGERVANKTAEPPEPEQPAKCQRCGACERIKTVGKLITSLSPVLGICGRCVSKEAGLD